jgi:hypothetical protein
MSDRITPIGRSSAPAAFVIALLAPMQSPIQCSGGRPRVVFTFAIRRGKIVRIELLADPARLARLDVVILD